jgi:hypothetical protein
MRSVLLLVSIGVLACDDPSEDPGTEVQASWRVRCPMGTTSCDYPQRDLIGTIHRDDRDYVYCTESSGQLQISLGRTSVISPSGSEPGFGVNAYLGYDPVTGFDLARQCRISIAEIDERQWGADCSEAAPSSTFPCQVTGAMRTGGSIALHLRCQGMRSIPVRAGMEADVSAGASASEPVTIAIDGCR